MLFMKTLNRVHMFFLIGVKVMIYAYRVLLTKKKDTSVLKGMVCCVIADKGKRTVWTMRQ